MENLSQNPVQLKESWRFKEGSEGLLFKKDSSFESGKLFGIKITDYKQLKATKEHSYRGECTVQFTVEGYDDVITFDRVSLSSFLVYKIHQAPEKYLDKNFITYSTTPDYWTCPVRLVKCKDSSYALFDVSEGGVEHYTVQIPGGDVENKQRFVTLPKEKYFRYYEAKQD